MIHFSVISLFQSLFYFIFLIFARVTTVHFMFAFLHIKPLSEKGFTLKENNLQDVCS